jgi:hypothetical protein
MGSSRNMPGEGSGKDLPESGFTGKYGKGKIEGGGFMNKGGATVRKMVGPGKGSAGWNKLWPVLPDKGAKKINGTVKKGVSSKTYNVGSSTSPSGANPDVGTILFGGTGGGGDQVIPVEKVSFLSSIPTIVWVILAVGGGYFLLKKM